jgi:hypothetical protein
MAVKGESKLNLRVPLALLWSAVGVLLLASLPLFLLTYARPQLGAPLIFLLSALIALPFLLQGPVALLLRRQRPALLKFLERLGPDTEITKSRAFTLQSYSLDIRAVWEGREHRFRYSYWALPGRTRPHVTMIWPTTRKGVSLQNRNRFNLFSRKFNTMEYTYLKNWHVRLFAYPVKDDLWSFRLTFFNAAKANENHLFECFKIALETKDKLERPNPAF